MYVIPSPGLRVPDPDLYDHLPEEGREVQDTFYWHRRIADKDVVVSVPPTPVAPPAPAVVAPAAAVAASATDKPAVADRSTTV